MTSAISRGWRLADGIRVGRDDDGQLYLLGGQKLALGPATPALLNCLQHLANGTGSAGPDEPIDHLRLFRSGWLVQVLRCGETLLLTRRWVNGSAGPAELAATELVLSALTVLHRGPDGLQLESATARSSLIVPPGPVLELIGQLVRPRTSAELTQLLADRLPPAVVIELLSELVTDGFVLDPAAEPGPDEHWAAHEAWFHARSRWGGRAAADYVGPRPEAALAPALGSQPDGPVLPLPRPDQADLNLSLAAVLAARTSVRRHDDEQPLTMPQLAAFLYFSASVRESFTYQATEFTRRSYPGGGTAYELEVYVAVGRVAGLAAGLYHYDPAEHALRQRAASATELLQRARLTALTDSTPQCLLLITARWGRILPRYQGMGYATTLKNVGALYQTMYLVATGLGLAPCALGNGDNAVLEAALGTDQLTESGVGEFLLGSRPRA